MSEMQNLKFLFPPRVKGIKIFDSEAALPGRQNLLHRKELC